MDPNFIPPPVPNYQQQQQPPPMAQHSNALAIWGLILAFFIPLVGFIISLIALSKAKKRGGDNRGMALAGTIVGASLLAVQLLALLALILYGVPFFQKAYRDVQRQDDVATFRVWLEEHSDSEDQLPDEDTFADGVPDLNLTYYNSLAEVVDSNTDDADREHILYVRDGQPTENTYYPNLDSLHVWGGSLCDSETFNISGDTYADGTIEAASPEDWAIVYRVEVTEGEDGISVTEGLICEDKNTVPSANFDFE